MKTTPIADWLDQLGSKTPTPGGGAVAALNGAVAIAQLKMVFMYSSPDESLGAEETYSKQIEAFLQLAEDDSKAYEYVREAYASKDQDKIKEALLKALKPSTDIIDRCKDTVDFCEINYQKFNPRLKADLVVALANVEASVISAQAMINTNLEALGENSPEDIAGLNSSKLIERINNLYKNLEK